jgi:transposase
MAVWHDNLTQRQNVQLRLILLHSYYLAMEIDPNHLPTDTNALQALVRQLLGTVQSQSLKIAELEAHIAKLKRSQFGQSSEKIALEIEQLEQELDALHEEEAVQAMARPAAVQALIEKPYRKALPEHLPRDVTVHEPACICPNCGGAMRKLGEDITEVLDYVPASFKVVRHVRPKLSCRLCETIVQLPMPSLPIERGKPGPGLLAHVLVAKYADHLPLYRQSGIYAREGVDLERSTLADWVGRATALLDPLIAALRKEVLASDILHGDDTPVPVLTPGLGKTKTGRLWTYVRDGRSYGSDMAPACAFFYSPDRKGERNRISKTSKAFYMLMAMRASMPSSKPEPSPRRPAGPMCAASSLTFMPQQVPPWPKRPSTGLLRSMPLRPRSRASRQMNEDGYVRNNQHR